MSYRSRSQRRAMRGGTPTAISLAADGIQFGGLPFIRRVSTTTIVQSVTPPSPAL